MSWITSLLISRIFGSRKFLLLTASLFTHNTEILILLVSQSSSSKKSVWWIVSYSSVNLCARLRALCWHIFFWHILYTGFKMRSLCYMCAPWGDVRQKLSPALWQWCWATLTAVSKILHSLFIYSTTVKRRWDISFQHNTEHSCFLKLTPVNVKCHEARPASLTWPALQRHALAVSELVSRAAVEAVICCADDAVCRAGLTPTPRGVEEPLRTGIPTLILKEVPGNPKLIYGARDERQMCSWTGTKTVISEMKQTGMQAH